MSKRIFLTIVLVVLAAVMVAPTLAQEPVTINWFVGLGGGTSDQQLEAQAQVVEDFNASHPEINLVLSVAPTFETAIDTLSTLIAAGTPPDVIGPVGVGGSNRYEWLDLSELMEANSYDLSGFDPALVDLMPPTMAVSVPFLSVYSPV